MAENSKIEWCDHTFNPWRGCSKVAGHPACDHCYAERLSHRNSKMLGVWGDNGVRVLSAAHSWDQPPRWNRRAAKNRERELVFCASLADVFEDWTGAIHDANGDMLWECCHCDRIMTHDPLRTLRSQGNKCDCSSQSPDLIPLSMQSARRRLFKMIDETPHLDWLLLTKRPENIERFWPAVSEEDSGGFDERGRSIMIPNYYRSNVWLGTSISNQATADMLIPRLFVSRDRCPILFVSAEPLLGPIDLQYSVNRMPWQLGGGDAIDWVIAGGESGPQARPSHPDWFRSLRDQCQQTKTAFFFKQWGEWITEKIISYPVVGVTKTETHFSKVGKAKAGRSLDGREWSQRPDRIFS